MGKDTSAHIWEIWYISRLSIFIFFMREFRSVYAHIYVNIKAMLTLWVQDIRSNKRHIPTNIQTINITRFLQSLSLLLNFSKGLPLMVSLQIIEFHSVYCKFGSLEVLKSDNKRYCSLSKKQLTLLWFSTQMNIVLICKTIAADKILWFLKYISLNNLTIIFFAQ